MTKHTPEPWDIIGSGGKKIIIRGDQRVVGNTRTEEDSEHIVACVNALAGMNPAAMREVVEFLQYANTVWTSYDATQRRARLEGIRLGAKRVLAQLEGSE